MGARWHRYSLMNTPTINTKKRKQQEAIDKALAEFMANGGKIEAEAARKAKPTANLHRNYAMSELEDGE